MLQDWIMDVCMEHWKKNMFVYFLICKTHQSNDHQENAAKNQNLSCSHDCKIFFSESLQTLGIVL